MNQKTIQDMHLLAEDRGISFKSDEYLGTKVAHLWECHNGHSWYARPSNIKTGHGCPECFNIKRKVKAKESRYDFEHYERMVRMHGGKLYFPPSSDPDRSITSTTRLVAECRDGHRWFTSGAVLSKGAWCGVCINKLRTLESREALYERALNYASMNKGHLTSTRGSVLSFKNSQASMKWSCHKGHEWTSSLHKMEVAGRWCSQCKHGDTTSLDDLRVEAQMRGGQCLSKKYNTGKDKYLWRCSAGHTWSATWFHVKHSATWCPTCNMKPRVKERICRVIFESIFKSKFPTQRPSWLDSLELDGYSADLGIAFEHQGLQHYIVDGHFNKTQHDLLLTQERDKIKKEVCEKNNVLLICIPDIDLRKSNMQIFNGVTQEIKARGILLDDLTISKGEDWKSKAWISEGYGKLYRMVEASGGSPVRIVIKSGKANLKYICECGLEHTSAVGYLLKRDMPGLCPECRVRKQRLPYIMRRAAYHGWTFIDFVGGDKDRGSFFCRSGHFFTRAVTRILSNATCPECYKAKRKEKKAIGSINKANAKAKDDASRSTLKDKLYDYVYERGGKITDEPNNLDSRYEITCRNGHSWRVLESSIRSNKSWCPSCGGVMKSSLAEMKEIAKARGGVCLSQNYVNSHTNLLWGCGVCSATWWAMPTNIKKGTWCPSCKGRRAKVRSGL